ncbi:MAG: YcxB family protein [Pseudomonas sp.]|uniref:YcxB family protein n=1 Tax=Pseudomonas sp. TaxID=306 RepID=UPI0033925E4B
MRLEYENKFRDLIQFYGAHQFCSPVLQIFIMGTAVFLFSVQLERSPMSVAATGAALWYAGMWLFQFLFNIIFYASRKNHSVLTKHILEITDNALIEETKYNKSFFYWNGVIKAVNRLGNVAIYVTPHSAHIVPRRAFASSAQRRELIALIQSKIEKR